MKIDAYAAHAAMQAALETQMRSQSQGAGLRMLRQIMAHMVRGELGLRVEIWRTSYTDHQRAVTGLRQLRQILYHMVQGEMAMRLDLWRTAWRDDQREFASSLLRGHQSSCTQLQALLQERDFELSHLRGLDERQAASMHRAEEETDRLRGEVKRARQEREQEALRWRQEVEQSPACH